MKDYYKILNLPPDCPQADIKKAYRKLAVQHHPDKNDGDKKSEERFKLVAEAYDILSDETTRNEYDYIKGFKTSYRNYRNTSGKPSPIKFLVHFKSIKSNVLHSGGHVKKQQLFNSLNNMLTIENIDYLIQERDIDTNHLIIDEILTCCIFLDNTLKTEIYAKLERLADGHPSFQEKVTRLESKQVNDSEKYKLEKNTETETSPPLTTVLIFALFILLFIFLLIYL
jgi:curved DNA-binding protein CbpA